MGIAATADKRDLGLRRPHRVAAPAACALPCGVSVAHGQDIEPRAFSNALPYTWLSGSASYAGESLASGPASGHRSMPPTSGAAPPPSTACRKTIAKRAGASAAPWPSRSMPKTPKLYASSGVSARTGNKYDILGIAWQYRWGAGL